jgi:formylglycine-generating enzyme required for sulfatase activity/TolB-like protein
MLLRRKDSYRRLFLTLVCLSLLLIQGLINGPQVEASVPLRVAVLELNNQSSLSDEELSYLSEAVRRGLADHKKLTVVTLEQLNMLLDPALKRSARSTPQAIELGLTLGADWVVMGLVTRISKSIRVELKVYEEPKGRLLAQHLIWSPTIDQLRVQLREVGTRLGAKAFYTLSLPPPKPKAKEEEDKEEIKVKLTDKEKRAWALSEAAQRELDDIQRNLDDVYERRRKEAIRKQEVLESEALREWGEIVNITGADLKFYDEEAQPVKVTWAEVNAAVKDVAKIGIKRQKKILLTFVDHYRNVPKYKRHVAEARDRYTWLNRQRVQWVTIRGGRFLIGSLYPIPDEWPVQWVSISTFQSGISEVTNAQYKKCVDAKVCTPPHWDDGTCHIYQDKKLYMGKLPAMSRRGDMPVVCIDWNQANRFAKWAGGRLFSESEWEFTARSGERTHLYPWGRSKATCEEAVMAINFHSGCGVGTPWPVCSKSLGSNSYGMCDLAGNVWEWVIDRYRPSHEKVPIDGRPVRGGGLKVIRGGSFASSHRELRASSRGQMKPTRRANYVGLRIARPWVE